MGTADSGWLLRHPTGICGFLGREKKIVFLHGRENAKVPLGTVKNYAQNCL